MLRSLRHRLPRIGKWPRLLIAATCLLLAAASALGGNHEAVGTPAHNAAVVVAARSLPAGHLLTAHDLVIARWPAALLPRGSRALTSALVGRRLAGPVAAREAITGVRLLGADLTTGLRAGFVAAPAPLTDPHVAELVRAGDRVDLLATARPPDLSDAAAPAAAKVQRVARGALVLAVLPATETADAEIVLAVDAATAVRITRDSASEVFTAVVASP